MRRASRAVIAATISLACGAIPGLLIGCGGGDIDQVKAKVRQFGSAAAAHDYRTICSEVLAPGLLRRLTAQGIGCRQAMGVAFDAVHGATLSIGSAKVHGDRATVITLTAARGQQASISAIKLVRTSDGWRISALGSQISPRSSP